MDKKKNLTNEQIKNFKNELEEANELNQFQEVANKIVDAGDTNWAKKIYIKALKKASEDDISCFQNAHKFFKADREVVLTAVKQWGPVLQYVDKKFKSDREILLATKPYLAPALDYADKSFLKDKEIIIAAIKQSQIGETRYVLERLDKSMQKDKDIVVPAIKKDGRALEHADKSFKKDKKIVKVAIKQNGRALEYADKKLKGDKKIVLAAVKQSGYALKYADKKLKADKEFILEVVKQYGRALQHADGKLQGDKEIALTAVKQDGRALEYADKKLKADKEFMLAAVKQNWPALQYADGKLKADKEVVLSAVKQNGSALAYADEKLKADKEFMLAAVKQIPMDKKREFRIEGGIKGGELVIGTVSVEFVKYWQERDDLIEHLESIREGKEGDANSPPMRDGKNFSWQECDDIEHILRPYAPSAEDGFKVEEITADINEKQIGDEAFKAYGREIYTSQINIDDENPDHDVSLLIFHRHEKEDLANWLVETDGEDFNPKKLAYGILETDVGDFIDSVYYDKKELVIEGGGSSQSYHCVAQVGVIESWWIKDYSKANVLKTVDWDEYNELLKEK